MRDGTRRDVKCKYVVAACDVASLYETALPPGTDCVQTNVTPAQRASFAYFGGLPFTGVAGGACRVMLLQDSIKSRAQQQQPGPEWQLLWEGRRASDRSERFRLFQRAR